MPDSITQLPLEPFKIKVFERILGVAFRKRMGDGS